MATRHEPLSLQVITSPFLRNVETAKQLDNGVSPVERRTFRKSLERLERINMIDLEPFSSESKQSSSPERVEERKHAKRQNRLSREILGVDDAVLSAPDNARLQSQEKQALKNQSSTNESLNETEVDDDANSVVFGGSVASTVPDRYGFFGGSQFSQETDKYVVGCNILYSVIHKILINFYFRNPAMIAVFRKRELKWLTMLDDWEKYMTSKYKKVDYLVLFLHNLSLKLIFIKFIIR